MPAKILTRRTAVSDWCYQKDITKRRVVHEMMSFILLVLGCVAVLLLDWLAVTSSSGIVRLAESTTQGFYWVGSWFKLPDLHSKR
jgi:hypothetical protein